MVNISESTVGRRYAGWFIRNTEHAQRVYDTLHNSPLPVPQKPAPPVKTEGQTPGAPPKTAPKVAWGGVKAV